MPIEFNSFEQEFLTNIDVTGNILSAGVNLLNIFTSGGGSIPSALSGNWQSTYNTVSSLSSTWSRVESLSFNPSSLILSITGSNSISLSSFKVIEKQPLFSYSSTNVLTGITYTGGVTKTFSYTGGVLSQQIYVRPNITTTYNYNYSNTGILTSISQTEVFS